LYRIKPNGLQASIRLHGRAAGREYGGMNSRVAFDSDAFHRLVDALNWRGGLEPDEESVAGVRIYFYITDPLITPTVAAEVEEEIHGLRAIWKKYHVRQIESADDFYRGCVKGMAERYLDYHPDPRDCHVVAEAECAKVEALVTLSDDLLRGLGGRSEVISVVRPSEYWHNARVPHGAHPRIEPAPVGPVVEASWWRW
jgi:hypothetical protein